MRRSVPVFINPLAYPLLILAKKASAYAFLEAGNKYGWPRMYRRLAEATRVYIPEKSRRIHVNELLKVSMRTPSRVMTVLNDHDVMVFARRITEEANKARQHPSLREFNKILDFLLPLIEAITRRTGVGRLFGWMQSLRNAK